MSRSSGRVVLFGATGYTGGLVLGSMLRLGLRPVLAGRDARRLAALGEPHGLDQAVADVTDAASVAALVEPGDVLVSTVGPFVRHGAAALEAAVTVGAHYLDSTGEGPFIREVFERYGPLARAREVALLTAFGYDFVPGNLAAALALREAEALGVTPVGVDVAYFLTGGSGGGMSGGTRASALGVLGGAGFTVRGGRLVETRPGTEVLRLTAGGRRRSAVTVSASEHLALPRLAPSLQQVNVGLGWFGPLSLPMALGQRLLGLADGLPPVHAGVDAVARRLAGPGSTGGPDEKARARTGSLVAAEVRDGRGDVVAHVELAGPNGYTLTGDLLAWGAQAVTAGAVQGSGALGPVDGFGLDALADGCSAAGLAEPTRR